MLDLTIGLVCKRKTIVVVITPRNRTWGTLAEVFVDLKDFNLSLLSDDELAISFFHLEKKSKFNDHKPKIYYAYHENRTFLNHRTNLKACNCTTALSASCFCLSFAISATFAIDFSWIIRNVLKIQLRNQKRKVLKIIIKHKITTILHNCHT